MTSIPTDARIGRIALTVNDLDKMTAFYQDIIGLALLDADDDCTVLGAGETALLMLQQNMDASERPESAAGLYHVAFRVPDREALGSVLQRAEKHGVLSGASDHGVSEALYLSDPEGNGIEVYRDRSRAQWPHNDDGTIRMGTQLLDLDRLRQDAGTEDTVPDGTTVGHVHLEVASLADARDFYVDTLGLNVRQETPHALFVAAGDYHHHVGLNTWHGRSDPNAGRGLAWFEIVVPDDTVSRMQETVEQDYGQVAPVDDGFSVTDPSGIVVHIRKA